MNYTKQFETMALLRAYAQKILEQSAGDLRPSTARTDYAAPIARMGEIVKELDVKS